MRIGGTAKKIIIIEDKNELKGVFEKEENIFLIGNGTNTLIYDGELNKTFVSLKELNKISELGDGIIKVDGGVAFSSLFGYTNKNDYTGFEKLFGIPGTVGGLVYMNAGANGSEIFDCIKEIEIFDENFEFKTLKKCEIEYSYRKTELQKRKCVVVSVTFQLQKGFKEEEVSKIHSFRKTKQPLESPNLGSIFKNPTGTFAAKLIDDANLKGFKIGGAEISKKHSNFIINTGNATFDDVINLIKFIKDKVKELYNVELEEEIIIVKN